MIYKIKELYDFEPETEAIEKIKKWKELFLNYNAHTNLMSKNDTKYLFEKHVLDSLSISLIPEFKNGASLLDIGAGGGFPSLIISIFFPEVKVIAIDSVGKKTNFILLAKKELKTDNLEIIHARAEEIPSLNVDFTTNRAVGTIANVWCFAKNHLKSGGYFVSYKAKTSREEADFAKKKYNELLGPRYFKYNLPLDENFTRELVVFKKR